MPHKNCYIANFKDVLDELESVICTLSSKGEVLIVGDLNAHFGAGVGPHTWERTCKSAKLIMKFNDRCMTNVFDVQNPCTGNVYTYMSDKNGCSYIDHIVVSNVLNDYMSDCHVWNESLQNTSDHLPISCNIRLDGLRALDTPVTPCGRLVWERLTPLQINERYSQPLEQQMLNCFKGCSIDDIDLQMLKPELSNSKCEYIIDKFCCTMVNIANKVVPRAMYAKHLKPYWDKELTELSKVKKGKLHSWERAGKPRLPGNKVWEEFKSAKKAFKKAHKKVIGAYEEREENELRETQSIDQGYFWHLVHRKMKVRQGISPVKAEDGKMLYDQEEITEDWANYAEKLGNVNECDRYDENFKLMVETAMNGIDAEVDIQSELFQIP
jgi:hypothetical protein